MAVGPSVLSKETDANRRPLGTLPVVVVASGAVATETGPATRNTADAPLQVLSIISLPIEAAGAWHEIDLFQPDQVIDGITRAVAAVRTGANSR